MARVPPRRIGAPRHCLETGFKVPSPAAAAAGLDQGRTLQPVTLPMAENVCSSAAIVTDGCKRRTMSTRRCLSSILEGARGQRDGAEVG